MHLRLLVALALLFAAAPRAAEPAPLRPCKEHPLVIDRCFVVHGELKIWNGNPTFRISLTGTGRVLGVSDQRFFREGYENLPAKLKALAQRGPVVADFEVCPFTREEPGVMQLVCVQSP